MSQRTSIEVKPQTLARLKKATLKRSAQRGNRVSYDQHINELQDLEDGAKRGVKVRQLKGV